MLLTHIINNQSISKKVSHDATLLTTNNLGGYLWLSNNNYSSRYQGWHVRLKGEVYKILDEIKINPQEKTCELKNIWLKETNYLQRRKGKTRETYYMPKYQNTLVYKLSEIRNIELILDIRKSYSSPQQKRYYDIYKKGDFLIIKYCARELNQPLFLAILSPSLKKWEKIERWIKKEGIFDKKRHSPPYFLYIYHALNFKTDKLIIGTGLSEENAIANILSSKFFCSMLSISSLEIISLEIHSKFNSFVKNLKIFQIQNSKLSSPIPRLLARQSLKDLLVYNKNGKILGLYAGLPWFFQFWLRDEAISLKALFQIDAKIANEILKKRIFSKKKSFRICSQDNNFPNLPNLSLSSKEPQIISTLDGLQWTLYRFLEEIQNTKHPIVNTKKIDQIIKYMIVNHIDKDGLVVNRISPTWMDSIRRSQFPIEMQALQLAIYNLAHKITREAKYKDMEKQLKNKVRFYFWNGKMLADGKNDWAIRPDIFLTYYIYPALLKKSEWENCFETALKALWLDWGGLSTVDKNSPFYYAEHTGENPRSYHQGDSWFWINNIAAISMIRLNKKKYLSKIKKILEASTKDLLWYGAIGHSSELSSAEKFSPAGSISQAWSAATYIELVDLFNTHNT
jgi:hypothetical protein